MNVKILQTGMDLVTGNSKVGEECFKFVESGLKKPDLSGIGDAAKSVGAKYFPDIDTLASKIDSLKVKKSPIESAKTHLEAVLNKFAAAEKKMLEDFIKLGKSGKIGDAIELAKNIPSKVMTKALALLAKGENLVADTGAKLKFKGGKICMENGELFTGTITRGGEIYNVKNGLMKAIETETEVIKFKG